MGIILRTKHLLSFGLVITLLGLFSGSIYAWYQINHLHLPISNVFAGLSTILPILTAVAAYYVTQKPTIEAFLGTFALLVVDAALLGRSTTYLSQEARDCTLTNKWVALYRVKSPVVKEIQDALQCCGFKSTRDKFYPFPSGEKPDPNLCEKNYPHRTGHPCYPALNHYEVVAAITFLLVPAIGALIKLFTLALLRYQRSAKGILDKPWLQTASHGAALAREEDYDDDAADHRNGEMGASRNGGGARHAVGYGSTERSGLLDSEEHGNGEEDEEQPWGRAMQPSSQTYAVSGV